MKAVDLRSDTITVPSAGMRRALAAAEVGDDVFGEDPTARQLEERVADLLGKEAALFVPSGVMGNQLAIKAHTDPGDEVICEAASHIPNYESGAPGLISGVQLRTIQGTRGVMTPEDVRGAIRVGHYWEPRPRLVCLENTHNKAGGVVQPQSVVDGIAAVAREAGLGIHLDGARIWNAAAALDCTEKQLAAPFDTVSACLSKGLGAPVGSVLAGPRDLIRTAHRFRKLLGGGMRQIGILAAAGLYALEHHRADLHDDHRRARRLADGIAGIDGFQVDPETVETNIVMFDCPRREATDVVQALSDHGVLVVPFGPHTIRATTHRDLDDAAIDRALAAFAKA